MIHCIIGAFNIEIWIRNMVYDSSKHETRSSALAETRGNAAAAKELTSCSLKGKYA